MPVIADTDEPPTKCCKYCDESTHGVDGPVSWRLTLDQDLIDTLKGSFPNWFPSSPVNSNNNNNNNNNNNSNSITTSSASSTTSSSSLSSSSSSSSSSTSVLSSDDSSCLTKKTTTTTTTTATLQVIEKSYQGNIIHEQFDGMAEGDRVSNSSASTGSSILGIGDGYDPRQSPPKAIVDSSPLQPAMDKNKESLKVKLMVRRPITTLVEQGIIPPLKTSPAIHEQCKQLERAKTGDLLKAKIQQRPDRQELERRHILEHDEIHVDPSLAEKQRMLKKARLADQLNSQISHRPGPLELIKKNILHTEKPIERIVKEGLVSFKATSEGLLTRPQQPNSYITFEDDSQSSEGDTRTSPPRTDVLEAAAASAGIVTVALTIPTSGGAVVVTSAPVLQTKFHPALITTPYVPPPPPPPPPSLIKSGEHIQVKQDTSNLFAELCQSVTGTSPSPTFLPLAASPASLGSSTSTLSPLSSVSSPPQSLTPRPVQSPLQQVQSQSQKSDAPGKDKNRKKNKSKPVSKARTIKFHEYKGPPNAQKSSSIDANQTTEETSYQLMLEQQNCLLRFLEKLNKNQAILPATTKNGNAAIDTCTQSMPAHPPPLPSPALSVSSSIPPSPAPSFAESTSSDITKLEKMKVSDLKLQLKKRNLPVSGPKPQLIERLKPYLPLDSMDTSTQEPISCNETSNQETVNSPRHSMSPESDHEHMDVQHADSPRPVIVTINDSLVREQQRKIDELQRQLERSQQELQQIRQNQHIVEQPPPPPPPINQKMVVKQQLEAKIQKQQAKNQALLKSKTPALIAPKEEKPPQQPQQVANQISMQPKPNNVGIVWNGEHPTLLLVGLQDKKLVNGHQRAASLPSIVFPISTTHNVEQVIDTKPIIQPQPMVTNVTETIPQIQVDIKPPPLYEEATKQLSTIVIKQEPTTKKHVKSENLTDVLDILIKNGDLPESALDPTTPTTPGSVVMVPGLIFENDRNNISAQQNRQTQQQRQQSHRQQQQPQRNTKTSSVSLEEDDSTFNASLLLNGPQSIQNIDMASPLQPECHIDSESAAKTIDIFLEQDVPPTNGDINHFDDLELMELMSQQLDMDIGDETCHGFPLMESNQQQQQKSNLNIRRDMNPSLQPSLNELIQQQNNNNNIHSNNTNHSNCNGIINGFNSNSFGLSNNTNNNYSSTPMDVCDDFENPLGSFDFSNLSQDSNINTPPHPFSSELSTPTPVVVAGSSGSEHHNNNPLSHSTLNMPLGSGCGGNNHHHQITANSSSSSCSNSNNVLVGGGSCCGNASSGMHLLNGTDNDTFDSHMPINQDNILDLFNIDDYKMTWGEVDFAV